MPSSPSARRPGPVLSDEAADRAPDLIGSIEKVARDHPDRPAVVTRAESWSYATLWRTAGTVSRSHAVVGSPPDRPVGLLVDGSPATIAAMVGVMLSGRAYAPIDVADPDPGERARRLGTDVLLVPERCSIREPTGLVVERFGPSSDRAPWLSAPADGHARKTEPRAYALLTSGTTAKAKVVEVSRANLSAYAAALAGRLDLAAVECWVMTSGSTTDLGHTALYPGLAAGGSVHILDEQLRRDPHEFQAYLQEVEADLLKMTPSHARWMFRHVADGWRRPLRYLVLGGERLSRELVHQLFADRIAERVVNHYGPTETTVGVLCNILRSAADVPANVPSVPIGRPLPGVSAVLVDGEGVVLPEDSSDVGELVVTGPTVGLGYRDDPERTSASFPTLDLDGGGSRRWYRTGDACRRLAGGDLEFVTRLDGQVKVRGWRIEPLAVEESLLGVPGVLAARVLVAGTPEAPALEAAVVTDGAVATDVRAALRRRVPAHLVPRRVTQVESIPLRDNGKPDDAALAAFLGRDAGDTSPGPPGSTPLEVEVASLWQQVLECGFVGLHDDFFDAGGDSIAAIQLLAELRGRGHEVTAAAFYARPTVAGVVASLDRPLPEPEPELWRGPVSPAQRWFLDGDFPEPNAWCQAVVLDCDDPLVLPWLADSAAQVVRAHPLLRARFARDGDRWVGDSSEPAPTVVDEAGLAHVDDEVIQAVVAAAIGRIDLATGRVVVFSLVRSHAPGPDRLVVVAHHLVVDGVSWRILLDDLARCYAAHAAGAPIELPDDGGSFWQWSRSLVGTSHPEGGPRTGPDGGRQAPAAGRHGVEAASASARFHLDNPTAAALARSVGARGWTLEEVMLATFVQAVASADPSRADSPLRVDVEEHGRDSVTTDLTRSVGWCTRVRRLDLVVTGAPLEQVVDRIRRARGPVVEGDHPYEPSADLCFNFLGRFSAPGGPGRDWRFSSLDAGALRGSANPRSHRWTMTCRLVQGTLEVDVSFAAATAGARLASEVHGRLLRLVEPDRPEAGSTPVAIEVRHRKSLGQLASPPAKAASSGAARRTEVGAGRFQRVLVTGATGFLGVYLLRELLDDPDLMIVCLVRARDDAHATERLRMTYAQYFHASLDEPQERLRAVAGDVTTARLGLDEAVYAELARTIDAIVHAAADVRLFADASEVEATNVGGTDEVVRFAVTHRLKDLHHVSTLSVAGATPPDARRVFSESHGAQALAFRSYYEASKLRAEALLGQVASHGGSFAIYRVGSLAAPVGQGGPQTDIATNRVAQMIREYVRRGVVPDLPGASLLLTPVDLVARAIVSVAKHGPQEGGCFHVAPDRPPDHNDIVQHLRTAGHDVDVVTADDFLLRGDATPEATLADWWVRREQGWLRFDNARTARVLADLGISFDAVPPSWMRTVLASILEGASRLPGTASEVQRS